MRNAALRATASYANWRSPAAQQILIQRATDKSLDLDARLDAADGLAQAVKLQAAGVQQDPPMFRALVGLLNARERMNRCVRRRLSLSLRFASISSGAPTAGSFLQMAGGRSGWTRSRPNRPATGSITAFAARPAAATRGTDSRGSVLRRGCSGEQEPR